MFIRRYTRLTNAFSRKIEDHAAAVALYYFAHNFIKIHRTLRVTPAMAAGVTGRLWEVPDLVALLGAEEWGLGRAAWDCRRFGCTVCQGNTMGKPRGAGTIVSIAFLFMAACNSHDRAAKYLLLPFAQAPMAGMTLIAHTAADPAPLVAAVRGVVHTLDADQPVTNAYTLEGLRTELFRPVSVALKVTLPVPCLTILAVPTMPPPAGVKE